jgi:hypothetical protein
VPQVGHLQERTVPVSALRRKNEEASADLGTTEELMIQKLGTSPSVAFHSGSANPSFHGSAGVDLIPDAFCVLL